MANVYSRMTKINNASGRSKYINDEERQEQILLQKKDIKFGWEFIREFEKEKSNADKQNWEAREIVIALPNDLANDLNKLEQVCDQLKTNILGDNRDCEYAVHWNDSRTNLHVHLLFSERQRVNELVQKTYKRDMWYDKDTNRMAKAHSDNAELRYKKGDVMKDKDGNIRYNSDPLWEKDPEFHRKSTLLEIQYVIQDSLKDFGYELGVQDRTTPYLSQRKEFKGASQDYLQTVKSYNHEVRQYNTAVKEHLEIEPEQLDTYKDIRFELETEINKENHISKSFSYKAIKVVRDIKEYVVELIQNLKEVITTALKITEASTELDEWWGENKDELLESIKLDEQLEHQKERLENYIETAHEVIDYQEDLIDEIENTYERKKEYGHSL